jgi:hypothetical protein
MHFLRFPVPRSPRDRALTRPVNNQHYFSREKNISILDAEWKKKREVEREGGGEREMNSVRPLDDNRVFMSGPLHNADIAYRARDRETMHVYAHFINCRCRGKKALFSKHVTRPRAVDNTAACLRAPIEQSRRFLTRDALCHAKRAIAPIARKVERQYSPRD